MRLVFGFSLSTRIKRVPQDTGVHSSGLLTPHSSDWLTDMRVCNSLLRPDRRRYSAFKIQNIFIESRDVKYRAALLLPVKAVNTTPKIVNMHTCGLLNGQGDDIVTGRSTQSRKFICALARAVALLRRNWSSRAIQSSSSFWFIVGCVIVFIVVVHRIRRCCTRCTVRVTHRERDIYIYL